MTTDDALVVAYLVHALALLVIAVWCFRIAATDWWEQRAERGAKQRDEAA